MPTLSVGAADRQVRRRPPRFPLWGPPPKPAQTRRSASGGVTLLEILIVTTLIALLAGLSYPSASAGLDTLRLRSAADQVVSFLNIALDRADRRQQVVEIRISQAENTIAARSSDSNFARSLEVPEPVRIIGIEPPLINVIGPEPPRRFLVYPGGAVPRIAIYLASKEGRKRRVIVDPVTGMIHSEAGIK